jgi:succinate dehydrogenase/fumarate reductase cytochrome b subunit
MEKTNINYPRLLQGGIVAGFTLFIFAGIVNGGILNADFENWMQGMGNLIHPLPQPVAMPLWTLMSLIHGIGGIWIYAGIRPRFGAGAKTALLAGFILWLVSKFTVALDLFALGIFPDKILAGQLIGSFFAIMLGTFLGAWVYKE